MSDVLLVGVDAGTTSCKVTVCTTDGRVVTVARAPLTWQVVPEGVETGADAVLAAARTAVEHALESAPALTVAAVGVTSMGEAGVLLDRRGDPVAPVIAWHDDRDRDLVGVLAEEIGGETFTGTTGLPLSPQWSLTKHRWLAAHRAGTERAVRRLSIAEWIVRALGGEEASEHSLASRTGWLRLDALRWWPEALAWSGATESLLPPLVQAGTDLGRATADWAEGRLAGAVLTVAGHDHLAAAVGAGAAADGDLLDSFGTAEALVRTVNAPLAPRAVQQLVAAGATVGHHALPGRLSLLADTRGGLLLQNVQSVLGIDPQGIAGLDAAAMEQGTGAVTAALDDDGTVRLSGIGRDASPPQVWHAALTASADRAARMSADLAAVAGPHRRTVMTGGWARSAAVRMLRRDTWGSLRVAPVEEAGGRGAALLAGCAAGIYSALDDLPPLPPGERPDEQPAPRPTEEVGRQQ